jgi:hypothetical protein
LAECKKYRQITYFDMSQAAVGLLHLARHGCRRSVADAADAIARLEASVAAASTSVAEGLRARVAYREAVGWLAHAHVDPSA